jgi:hypothetical protein
MAGLYVRQTMESILEQACHIKTLSVTARDFEGGPLVGCFRARFCVKFPVDGISAFLGRDARMFCFALLSVSHMTTISDHRTARVVSVVTAFGCLLLICCADAVSQETRDFKGDLHLPNIVRYTELPRRMYLEPEFSLPPNIRYLEPRLPAFYERVLRSPADDEILIEAVQCLERVQDEEYADVSHVAELLQQHLVDNDNENVRQSCASALASMGRSEFATDVARYCVPRYEALCLDIEPTFASWGKDGLKDTWLQRVETPAAFSDALVDLACHGLSQLKEAAALRALEELMASPTASYPVRHAAARAVARIDRLKSIQLAQTFMDGPVTDRLLACALLRHCESDDGFVLLDRLCDDSSNAVASRGWEALFAQKPVQLVEKLASGAVHTESNVRLTTIRVLRMFPNAAGCVMLQAMTSDVHIGVRNSARHVLRDFSNMDSDLRGKILAGAGAAILNENSGWQELEQSLVLLGELRHREWQSEQIRLLAHPRGEVYVTAAWLLHLMPNQAAAEEIATITTQRYEVIASVDNALQLMFLFQHAGIIHAESLQPLCEKQFVKGALAEMRAAGLWALGKINTGNPDTRLIPKLVERIFDDDIEDPENFDVRRMCVLALVWMDARSSLPDIRRARRSYGEVSMLGEACRWALPQLGADPLPPLESLRVPIRNFPISPL